LKLQFWQVKARLLGSLPDAVTNKFSFIINGHNITQAFAFSFCVSEWSFQGLVRKIEKLTVLQFITHVLCSFYLLTVYNKLLLVLWLTPIIMHLLAPALCFCISPVWFRYLRGS
jgi:hypothetical protein